MEKLRDFLFEKFHQNWKPYTEIKLFLAKLKSLNLKILRALRRRT